MPVSALDSPGDVVPMAGRWEADGDALRFTPRFPFARGAAYAVVIREGDGWVEAARLRRPAADAVPTAAVVAVHPDVVEVPENLLRLAVTFSTPMDEGSAAGRIRLEDRAGEEIPQALLPMPPELWDRARRRLTLLLEPGRIKRGLVPNTALGAPLAGHTGFDLVIDATIRDAAGGAPLITGARRSYAVGPPVRTRVDPRSWDVFWPAPGTADALVVRFDRPLDAALALRCLTVGDADGRRVPGAAAVDDGDTRWTFRPRLRWPGTGMALHVDGALEDLAGNSVRRVFDRDLRLEADAPAAVDEIVLTPGGRAAASS